MMQTFSQGLLLLSLLSLITPVHCAVAQPPAPAAPQGIWRNGDESGTLLSSHILGAAAALPDGRIIAAGGLAPSLQGASAIALAEIYDPQKARWMPTRPMSTGRWAFDAITLRDGRVLFAGGASGFAVSAVLDSAELFVPDSMSFLPVANRLSAARHSFGISMLANGQVLITGGCTQGNSLNGSGTVHADLYDPQSNSFSPAASLNSGRSLHAQLTLSDGKVAVIGGAQRSAEIFDPELGQWTTLPGLLPTTLKDMKALETFDGRIFIAGGQNTQDGLTTDETWFLDLSSGQFSPGPSMKGFNYSSEGTHVGCSDYSAFDLFPAPHKLSGRYLFFAGGEHDPLSGPDVELNSSCLFLVAENRFIDLGPMPFAHDDHTEAMSGFNRNGNPEVVLFGGNKSTGTSRFEFLRNSLPQEPPRTP